MLKFNIVFSFLFFSILFFSSLLLNINTYTTKNTQEEGDNPPNSSKNLKPTPTADEVNNYERNTKYLELRKHKFWHLAKEKRYLFTSLTKEEATERAFNDEYVRVNSYPPLSTLRIRSTGP